MPTFISTPTNSDKNLSGWNSRFIYNYAGGSVEINKSSSENEIFGVINNTTKKGSVNLGEDYFFCDDGNSLKITMYFTAVLSGTTLRFDTGVKDNINGNEYILATKNGGYHTLASKANNNKLFKYEAILTKFKTSTPVNDIDLYVTGNITYSCAEATNSEDGDVRFIEQYGKTQFPQVINSKLIIKVRGTTPITVMSLTVEEIK